MPFIIAILTLATTFFIAYRRFNESGLSTDLNPFLFFRRRAWNQRRETNPLFILDNYNDIASALLFIIAKLDVELTRESKLALELDYQHLLGMNAKDANAALQQNSFILTQYPIVRADLKRILHKDSVTYFSADNAKQLVEQLRVVAIRENAMSNEQRDWIADIEKLLASAQGQLF